MPTTYATAATATQRPTILIRSIVTGEWPPGNRGECARQSLQLGHDHRMHVEPRHDHAFPSGVLLISRSLPAGLQVHALDAGTRRRTSRRMSWIGTISSRSGTSSIGKA